MRAKHNALLCGGAIYLHEQAQITINLFID